jgi:sulfur relay protein TusB/DsrH
MNDQKMIGDIGFVITKAPMEYSVIKKLLTAMLEGVNNNEKIGLFLVSDGVFLIKKYQKNEISNILKKILTKNIEIMVSKEHLEAAGISEDEIFDKCSISEKPYDDLVDFVMEKYERVVTI